MDRPDTVRIIHVGAPPSRLATIRDVAIVLLCAALLLGTIADVLLAPRGPGAAAPARPTASVSM